MDLEPRGGRIKSKTGIALSDAGLRTHLESIEPDSNIQVLSYSETLSTEIVPSFILPVMVTFLPAWSVTFAWSAIL